MDDAERKTFNLPAVIDYKRLAEAQAFFEGHGFEYIEVPWAVSAEATAITLPANKQAFALGDHGFLVGSAEQSFIEMIRNGVPLDTHCAITPCFRDDKIDRWHQTGFVKLELFRFLPEGMARPVVQKYMRHMIDIASEWHGRFLRVTTIDTPEGVDIVCADSGVELGSYGVRWLEGFGGWIYGTGHAEPRFGQVRSLQKETPSGIAAERRLQAG